jgi:hypothetical protein
MVDAVVVAEMTFLVEFLVQAALALLDVAVGAVAAQVLMLARILSHVLATVAEVS